MTDHANELRRYSRKIGHPAGDVPSVMLAAADEIERLAARLEAAEKERDWHAEHCEDAMNECARLRTAVRHESDCVEAAKTKLKALHAKPAPKAVAYLDLGVGGYMDIGTDLTDEELATLPKGRRMLGVIGTYGVDGYVPAQPEPSVPVAALRPVIGWLRNGCDPQEAAKELEILIAAAPEAKP